VPARIQDADPGLFRGGEEARGQTINDDCVDVRLLREEAAKA
jgi:hypothetical protein